MCQDIFLQYCGVWDRIAAAGSKKNDDRPDFRYSCYNFLHFNAYVVSIMQALLA